MREFTELPERPDEIWVVQINPQQREFEPRSRPEISTAGTTVWQSGARSGIVLYYEN
ncbi:Ferredoxin reductase (plasmid) [Sinorhizobium sp. CCBAU 05631]|nr:Ferredoxin reductase [Sinorhizobium sp. CCBAU 05631]